MQVRNEPGLCGRQTSIIEVLKARSFGAGLLQNAPERSGRCGDYTVFFSLGTSNAMVQRCGACDLSSQKVQADLRTPVKTAVRLETMLKPLHIVHRGQRKLGVFVDH